MTTDLRNFRCFIHKIQVIQTNLKVTYLHRWNFLTLFFVYVYSVSRTDLMLCFSLLVNRKTHKALLFSLLWKKKRIITSCRVIIPRIILLKSHDFFIRRRKIIMLTTYWLIWVISIRILRIIKFFFFNYCFRLTVVTRCCTV